VEPLRGLSKGKVDVVVNETPQPLSRLHKLPCSPFRAFGELSQCGFYRTGGLVRLYEGSKPSDLLITDRHPDVVAHTQDAFCGTGYAEE
jgi:hypothetical protein